MAHAESAARCAVLLLAACLALLLWSAAAMAHKPSDSLLMLQVDQAEISGRWDVALRDLDLVIGLDTNADAQITWDEIKARQPDISRHALSQLRIQADGEPCPLTAKSNALVDHNDGPYAVIELQGRCASPVRRLDINYRLLFDADQQHKGLLNLNYPGQPAQTAIFSADAPERSFQLGAAAWHQVAGDYLKHGVWHIWIGFDHILFLVSLLLPAALCRRDGRWQPAEGFGAALGELTRVVTAFTVAHSLTLIAASQAWLVLPARWVESAIAASVVLAAANNLYPVIDRRRWLVAFGFGLIHGFGFAGVLAELGLPDGARMFALLAFNVGVELGQLAIVALLLPLIFALRGTRFYRFGIFAGGSAVIATLGCGWLLERAFDWKLPFYG